MVMSDLPGRSRGIIIKMSLGLIERGSNNWHGTVFKLLHKWDDTGAYLRSRRRCIGFDQFLELYSSLSVGQRNLVFSILLSPPNPHSSWALCRLAFASWYKAADVNRAWAVPDSMSTGLAPSLSRADC